jgi:hypothetical protein
MKKLQIGKHATTCALTALLFSGSIALPALSAPAVSESALPINPVTGVAGSLEWKEEYAHSLGVQAYTYAFPWFYNASLRWQFIAQPAVSEKSLSMPLNTFGHHRHLTDASWTHGGGPNNDTLYSSAFVDISKEPVIISHPDMGDRYFSFQFVAFDSDNFAYIGTRTTGSGAGNFAVAGPDWQGTLPQGVTMLARAPTSTIILLGRAVVDGKDDLDAVHRLQDQYRITPLSLWGKKDAVIPENRDVFKPYDRKSDPLADWKTINRAMTEIPPRASEMAYVEQFRQIGIGPGLNVDEMDAATQRGLIRALETAKGIVTGMATTSAGTTITDTGWSLSRAEWGHFGNSGEFALRSAMQSLQGIVSHDLVEAMYPQTFVDSNGDPLSGDHRYALHFTKDNLPPVKAFWSITAYGLDFNLIDNPIDRYSVGDRTRGLQYDTDGGLTLYFQKDSPGAGKESNWLPSGAAGFALAFRLYIPEQRAIDGDWQPPALKRID